MSPKKNSQIQQFKLFLHEHPLFIKEIRNGHINLQEAYEQYVLLGEEDPSWQQYKGEKESTSSKDSHQLYKKLWKHVEQLDLDQVEEHIHHLNGALHNVIKVIDQFKQPKHKNLKESDVNQHIYHPYD